MVKRVGKYEIGKTLGEGTFGKVKFAVNTETGEKVAIKILDKEKIQKQNMGAQIKKEISIMKVVKHRHVVKLFEVLASRTKIFMVLELITGGELFDKIVAEGRFNEDTARFYWRQLIRGLKFCHAQGVCHRDLKPENLLLDQDGNLKISDFGLSALYTGSSDDKGRATLLHTTCGTPNYVAPEVLNDKGYDGRAADVWSCGVILYVLLAGFLPFDEPHMSALFRKIQKAEFTYPSWFTPQVRAMLDRILVPDPTKRSSIGDIEADPWFIGPDAYHDVDPALEAMLAAMAAGTDPSSKDVEEAVEELPETKDDDDKPAPAAKETRAPRLLNAFDIVNMFGGLALNRLLEAGDKREKLLAVTPQFISNMPADKILSRASAALTSLGAEVKADEAAFKVKGKIVTRRGEITINFVIFRMSEALHLVEVHRGRGDILEYNGIYTKLRELLNDLVTKGSSARLR